MGVHTASSVVSRLGQRARYALRRLSRWRPIQPPSRPRDLIRVPVSPTARLLALQTGDSATQPPHGWSPAPLLPLRTHVWQELP